MSPLLDKKDDYNSLHKTNLNPIIFHSYLVAIALFVAIFSITFLINQFVAKQDLINVIFPNLKPSISSEEIEKLYLGAKQTWNLWSLSTYLGGLSTIMIFFVFVLFGRTKVKYGFFFRTLWAIIFAGAAIFIFFVNGMSLWQKILNAFILFSLFIITIIDLLKVNRKRENLKFEIRNEWRNKQHNHISGGT